MRCVLLMLVREVPCVQTRRLSAATCADMDHERPCWAAPGPSPSQHQQVEEAKTAHST